VEHVIVLALAAALNPTLVAASTVMMLLPNPKRLMFGYLLGAYTTSITAGLLIVFSLHGSASESTAHTMGPIEDIVVGLVALLVAYVLGSGRDARLQERRRRRKEAKETDSEKKESLPERMLGHGSPRITFVVGVLLTFPGVSYLTALDRMATEQGQKHNLDAPRLQACIKAQQDDIVKASVHEGEGLGVEATPTMFINGEKVDGALPVGELRDVLDRALVQAGETAPVHPAAAANETQPASK